MSDGKTLATALKKDALREHYIRKAQENKACGRITKIACQLEIDAINRRYEFTEAERNAFDAAMIRNFKRA